MTSPDFGGDEFILLVPDCDDEKITTLSMTLLMRFDDPFAIGGHAINVTLSVGVSLYPQHGETLHELKFKADAAMYHIKQEGRNGWAIYRPEMSKSITMEPSFLQDLTRRLSASSLSCGISLPIWPTLTRFMVLKP